MSGRPGRSFACNLYRYPSACRRRRTTNSGAVSFRLTRFISAERPGSTGPSTEISWAAVTRQWESREVRARSEPFDCKIGVGVEDDVKELQTITCGCSFDRDPSSCPSFSTGCQRAEEHRPWADQYRGPRVPPSRITSRRDPQRPPWQALGQLPVEPVVELHARPILPHPFERWLCPVVENRGALVVAGRPGWRAPP